MNRKKYLLLSFFIPFFFLMIVFYFNDFFSIQTPVMGDAKVQYYPLFNYLKNVLSGTQSIFYSFSKGLGGTMFGTFFYYLSSPLNLLLYFISYSNIIDFMGLLIILKLCLCSVTMYLYLSHKFKKDSLILVCFSLFYCFSNYNLHFYINIMWLDVVFLAPLVLWGIDRLVEGKSPLLYVATLSLAILSNYYIAYMLCLFSVLYFFYQLCLSHNLKKDKKNIKKKILSFFGYSFLSGLLCAFILLPLLLEMSQYHRGINIQELLVFPHNPLDLISKSFLSSFGYLYYLPFDNQGLDIYCGIIILPLLFFYFRNQNISKKEKICSFIFLIFLILPNFFQVFNFLWHLFTLPEGYGYRYGFLVSLFLITLAYRQYQTLEFKRKDIIFYFLFYLFCSIMILILKKEDVYAFLDSSLIWITLIFLVIYLLIMLFLSKKKLGKILLISLFMLECYLQVFLSFQKETFDLKESIGYINATERYKNLGRIGLDSNKDGYGVNESFLGNYYSSDIFLSTLNRENLKSLYKLNYSFEEMGEDMNAYLYVNNGNYIADALLGIKTIIKDRESLDYPLIEYDEKENVYIYDNPNALSLGYMVKANCNNLDSKLYDQKALNCLMGENNTFYKKISPLSIEESTNRYQVPKGYYLIYMNNLEYYFDNLPPSITYWGLHNVIGRVSEDTVLELTIPNKDDQESIEVYYFDYDLFEEKVKLLKKEQLEYKLENDSLTGTIKTEGGLMFLSIPYEKGLHILVDGKETSYIPVLDSFVGVTLEPGTHDIKVTYRVPGLVAGTCISIGTLFATIFVSYNRKIRNKSCKTKMRKTHKKLKT